MRRPVGSGCPGPIPWMAIDGNAWWLLCQPSPNEKQRDEQVVAAGVLGVEVSRAERMADRIDGEHHLVVHGDAHEASPDEAAPAVDQHRDDEPGEEPELGRAVDGHDEPVFEEAAAVALARCRLDGEDPADVGVQEAVERRVRVALAIGVGMVLEVSRRPVDRPARNGHCARDQRQGLDRCVGLEAAMREQAVIAEGRAEPRDDCEHREQRQVDRARPSGARGPTRRRRRPSTARRAGTRCPPARRPCRAGARTA